ncbi:MAG: DUF6580 family putative transport protein [Thermoanaerobaculaceae bacterium]
MGIFGKKLAVLSGLILLAALFRLLPHPPNFSPMVAVSLLSGAHLGKRFWAFLLPGFAWLATDGFLELLTGQGFHSNMPAVYISMLLIVALGGNLQGRVAVKSLTLASLVSSTLFYFLTNFSVWFTGTLYPHTPSGLVACYLAALPFFGLSLLGDLVFSFLLFGTYAALAKRYLQPVRA